MYPIYEKINFLEINIPLAKADAVIVPIPYESTVSARPGAKYGPSALLSASYELECFDEELLMNISKKVNIATDKPMYPNVDSPKQMISMIESHVLNLLKKNKFVISLGGEHTISVGSVSAYKKHFGEIVVVQIDAHPDLRNEYNYSKYSHACTMRRIHEIVGNENVIHIGNRTMSEEEYSFIKKNKLESNFYPNLSDSNFRGIINKLAKMKKPVYITIDMDGFDPSEVPAVGTPVPGGLHWMQSLNLLKQIAHTNKILGFDITELAPIPNQMHSQMFAAKLLYKLIGYSFL